MKKELLLASTSPYRKKLLEKTRIPFKTAKPICNEDALKLAYRGAPPGLCAFLAKEKALSLVKQYPDHIIIGSDQSLLFENTHLGKGHSYEGSLRQLKKLAGNKATLITAVYIYDSNKAASFESNTDLTFKDLSNEQIDSYLNLDKPYNCAGSFKFEEHGIFLFKEVSTKDPSSIEGLPLIKLSIELQKRGFTL